MNCTACGNTAYSYGGSFSCVDVKCSRNFFVSLDSSAVYAKKYRLPLSGENRPKIIGGYRFASLTYGWKDISGSTCMVWKDWERRCDNIEIPFVPIKVSEFDKTVEDLIIRFQKLEMLQ